MKNSINWFEIPVKNFERAKVFYNGIFNSEINVMPHPTHKYGMLPADLQSGGIGGAIVEGEGYEPASNGALIYLNGGEDLSIPLSKVEPAGGKIIMDKTSIGPNGFMAQFMDTEGNKVALHSMN